MAAPNSKKFKKKEDYIDLFEEMIEHYSKEENKDLFNYKQYYFAKGFRETALKAMCIKYPDVNALYIDLKHIIIATLTRMILQNVIQKDAFAVRTMKLMFKDLSYHTPEEIAQIEKLQAERALDNANNEHINFSIGYDDDSNAEDYNTP